MFASRHLPRLMAEALERRTLFAAGTLVQSFGSAGRVVDLTNVQPYSSPIVVAQADGKILVGTTTVDGSARFVRYNTDGSVDTLYGVGGTSRTSAAQSLTLAAVAMESDGKLVFSATENDGVAVYRLNTDGSIDTAFGTGGSQLLPGAVYSVGGIGIQADHRILVGTSDGLHRLTAAGAVDSTWTSDHGETLAFALDGNGKVIEADEVGGFSTYLTRLNTDSSVDSSFVQADVGGYVRSLIVTPTNAIRVAVDKTEHGGVMAVMELQGLTSTGALDMTFGTGGVVPNIGAPDAVSQLLQQPDGKLLAVGNNVRRFTADGGVDLTFGSFGSAELAYGDLGGGMGSGSGSFYNRSNVAALEPDGRLIVSGRGGQTATQTCALDTTGSTAVATTLTLTAPAAATTAVPVTLTAEVSTPDTSLRPTGTVQFFSNGNYLGSAPAVAPTLTATLSATAGTTTVSAVYLTDDAYGAHYGASVSNTVRVTVSQSTAVTIEVAPATTPVTTATPVDLTASVSGGTPYRSPSGTVTFSVGSTVLGTATLNYDTTATLHVPSLPLGAVAITASYAGDDTFAPSSFTSTSPIDVLTPAISGAVTRSTVPATVLTDQAVREIAAVTLTNTGRQTLPGKSSVRVYASTTGVIDGSSVLVGSYTARLPLKPGKSAVVRVPLKIAAGQLPAGSYALVTRAADSSGVSADSAAGPAFAVVTAVHTFSASATLSAAKKSAVAVTLVGTGNTVTTGRYTIAVTAAAGAPVRTAVVRLSIVPGKIKRVVIALGATAALPAGAYTVLVTGPFGDTATATT